MKDRKTVAERFGLRPDLVEHRLVLSMLQHTIDQGDDLLHLSYLRPARRDDGRAQPDATSDGRWFLIIRYGILVDDDYGGVQRGVCFLTGDALVGKVHLHEMRVGASRNDLIASIKESMRQHLCVSDHLLLV